MKRLNTWKKAGVALLAASALVLTACSGGGGGDNGSSGDSGGGDVGDGILHIGTTTEVVNWTPLNSVSITDIWVIYQMYPSLQALNSDGTYSPHLADSIETSEDGTSVIIKMNPDFKWSDGEPITAEDIAFTLDRLRDDSLLAGKPSLETTTQQSSKMTTPPS